MQPVNSTSRYIAERGTVVLTGTQVDSHRVAVTVEGTGKVEAARSNHRAHVNVSSELIVLIAIGTVGTAVVNPAGKGLPVCIAVNHVRVGQGTASCDCCPCILPRHRCCYSQQRDEDLVKDSWSIHI